MRQLLFFRTHYFISQINKTRNHRRGTTNDIFIYQRHIVYFRMMDSQMIPISKYILNRKQKRAAQ